MKEFPITFQTPQFLFDAKESMFRKIEELGLHNVEIGGDGSGANESEEDQGAVVN